jgi:RimJ/RimL family protein N-acetyltransferase
MKEIKISNKISMRHIKFSDAQVFFDAEQDEDAKRNFMTIPGNVASVKKDIKDEISEYEKEKPNSEKFTILYEGKVAGWIAINQLNNRFFEHRAKVDFCLHQDYRGKGIMTKVLKEVVSHAFKKYKLMRLEAWTRTFNKAVAKLNEKVGFKLEGTLRKNKCKNGEYLDDMVWAIVR